MDSKDAQKPGMTDQVLATVNSAIARQAVEPPTVSDQRIRYAYSMRQAERKDMAMLDEAGQLIAGLVRVASVSRWISVGQVLSYINRKR